MILAQVLTGQWDRIGSPEVNSDTCGQLIFDQVAKTIKWGKVGLFQQTMLQKTGYLHGKE